MAKMPRDISGQQVVTALQRIDFYIYHQKGSHIIMRRDDPKTTVCIPNHRRLRVGTLRAILNQTGLKIQEFTELL